MHQTSEGMAASSCFLLIKHNQGKSEDPLGPGTGAKKSKSYDNSHCIVVCIVKIVYQLILMFLRQNESS